MPWIVAGCLAVGIWGLALLGGALPALACLPSSRRNLRLGAAGVLISTAQVHPQSPPTQCNPCGPRTHAPYMISTAFRREPATIEFTTIVLAGPACVALPLLPNQMQVSLLEKVAVGAQGGAFVCLGYIIAFFWDFWAQAGPTASEIIRYLSPLLLSLRTISHILLASITMLLHGHNGATPFSCDAALPRNPLESHRYAKVPLDDGSLEMTGQTQGGQGQGGGDGEAGATSDMTPPPAGRGSDWSGAMMVMVGLISFALLRGVDIGRDIFVVTESQLEVGVLTTLGEVVLVAASLSIILQDLRIPLSRGAQLVFLYSLTAPLGIGLGATLKIPTDSNGIPMAASVAAGLILFQVLTKALPKDATDLALARRHKMEGPGGEGGSKESSAWFLRTSLHRLGCFLGGWAIMMTLNIDHLMPSQD